MNQFQASKILRAAAQDLAANGEDWENPSLGRFLQAWSAWLEDLPGWFANREEPVPENPTWKLVADMVMAARSYE